MITQTPPVQHDAEPGFGYIGKIPVRNLWLLMLYASEFFSAKNESKVQYETAPDSIIDLIAEILAHAVEKRLRWQLTHGYRKQQSALTRVRGRIDVLATERQKLMSRGRIACLYDEFTVDTSRNRFVRGALELASRKTNNRETVQRCRKLANEMHLRGVSKTPLSYQSIRTDQFGRHDGHDRLMVSAAKLVFELLLLTESPGKNTSPIPDRNEVWIRNLFEKAVGGFFETVLPSNDWSVGKGKKLSWQSRDHSAGASKILPGMQTDIVLDHKSTTRRIVIDTKFNSILSKNQYDKYTLRSGYLYQIYAYLQSQVGQGDPYADNAEGVLLHPAAGESIDESLTIQGHRIRFMTVDLAGDPLVIRDQLLRVVADASENTAISLDG